MKNLVFSIGLLSLISFNGQSTPVKWEPLEKGDKIHVVAPSYGDENTRQNLAKAHEVLQKKGFKIEAPLTLIESQPLGYANTVQYKQEHLRKTLFENDCKAVWALRGGRGASEIVIPLEELPAPSKPKFILGFSDATVLHLLAAMWGWPSLHCPVLAYNQDIALTVNKATSLDLVLDILSGKTKEVNYTLSLLNNLPQKFEEEIEASVVGGNASLIQRSIGTPTHLKTTGKILFLEDTGEPATKFLEIMTHFRRANLFKDVKAIILGDFKNGLAPEECLKLEVAQHSFVTTMTALNIPVLGSNQFGHGDMNYPLPFGTPAKLIFQNSKEIKLTVKTNN